jgi:hypothetical protein
LRENGLPPPRRAIWGLHPPRQPGGSDQLPLRHRRGGTSLLLGLRIKSFYQPRSHPQAWSVNLNALDDVGALTITARVFDGRNWEQARTALDD